MGLMKSFLSESETSILLQQAHLREAYQGFRNTGIILCIKLSHCSGERNTSFLWFQHLNTTEMLHSK